MFNKKILIIASLIAIFITDLTMASFLVISTDLSYFRIGYSRLSGSQGIDYLIYPKSAELNINNVGKTTIGQGGFPFSWYSNCSLIKRENNKIYPVCPCELSSFDCSFGFSYFLLLPLLNIFVWTFFFYSLLIFIQTLGNKANRKKSALIFVIAITILIISVFVNDFIGLQITHLLDKLYFLKFLFQKN